MGRWDDRDLPKKLVAPLHSFCNSVAARSAAQGGGGALWESKGSARLSGIVSIKYGCGWVAFLAENP